MRRIGDPRAIAVLASLPQRGLRGCTILAPRCFVRGSSSGAGGRGRGGIGGGEDEGGRGIGSAEPSDDGPTVRAGAGRGAPQKKPERSWSTDELSRGRFLEWESGALTQNRVSSVSAPQHGRGGAERGRGIPLNPIPQQEEQQQQDAAREEVPSAFGRGRGIFSPPASESASGGRTPPPLSPLRAGGSSASRAIPLEERDADVPQLQQHNIEAAEVEGSSQERIALQVSLNPESQAPDVKPKLPFRMPFARPGTEQLQEQSVLQAQPSTSLGPLGRGRGQPGNVPPQPAIGAESWATQRPPSRFQRAPDGSRRKGPPGPPSPPRMQLSVEEARARAISILEKGIEKNVAAEGERRRKAGIDKFADATEFLADRFNRAQGPSSPSTQPQRSRAERQNADMRRRDRPRRRRSEDNASAVDESAMVTQLTPEQEAQILRLQEEDTFKERLHNLFLAQFEPEFAMEEFGRNPDIHEPPVLSLEEFLQSHKKYFLDEDADLSLQQKFQEAVKISLANAPDLEKLVEAYAGPGRMTSRQQIEKLQTIYEKLPTTVSPEVGAFSQRAFLTIQNNPRLNMHHKEKLMTNIVSGFS